MSHRPSKVLIVGATGSIGRYAVAEALRQGYAVRALDAAEDVVDLPTEREPEMFRADLAAITAGSLKAGD
ncbi:NAD-dependent epimerase/dehydratase family protein [Arthrobacter oryzae]|uniref:NAD-dependent epimerase/dehydratase family protein n=1 Tax=Arthrobacter oryzae TaxID=409290 RepID=A0A495EQN5_9MICC|nr:NAD-dependent epimerase/dehydratase family protein [Arthrobacter oryzae]RKR18636.1 NAD-dependent epimerase/dehydratase family protein [Arthrobacter oryzae]